MPLYDATKFVLRLFKYAEGNPAYVWSNSYEIGSQPEVALGEPGDLNAMLADIALAEAVFHFSNIRYDRATLSSWQPDSDPYDTDSFVSVPLNFNGLRGAFADPLPRKIVLLARKIVPLGHSGKNFYRGVLDEADVNASSGLGAFLEAAAVATFNAYFADFFTAFNSAVELSMGEAFSMQLVGIEESGSGPQVLGRNVTGMVPSKVTTLSDNHRYYDLPPP